MYNAPMRPSTLRSSLLILTIASILSGCETTNRVLTSAERAVKSRTGQTIIDLAEGKDPSQIAKRRLNEYARDPESLLRDLQAAHRDFKALYEALGGKVGATWGKKEVKLPEQKKYVKYTQNYKSRAIVDFDKGDILVETLDEQEILQVTGLRPAPRPGMLQLPVPVAAFGRNGSKLREGGS